MSSPAHLACRAAPTTLLALAALLATMAGAAPAPAVAANLPWTEALTQQALSSGFLTRLPPTVSVALDLPKAKEGADVRALISKSGHQVRTFNVCLARHGDLVVFNVNARTATTVAYLIGVDARLRKAVSYQAGGEAREIPAGEARAGLAREVRFWSARARHVSPPAAQ
jgi:hypothetical protein